MCLKSVMSYVLIMTLKRHLYVDCVVFEWCEIRHLQKSFQIRFYIFLNRSNFNEEFFFIDLNYFLKFYGLLDL